MALRNTRAACKHVFLIIGSSRRLEDWGENKTQDREATGLKGNGDGESRPSPSLHPQVPDTFPGNPNIPKEHLEWQTHRTVNLGEQVEYVSSNIFVCR